MSLRTAAGQRQSFEQPLSHAVACCDKPRGSDRVRSIGQKKGSGAKKGKGENSNYRHMFVLSYMYFTFGNFRHRLVRPYVIIKFTLRILLHIILDLDFA